MIAVTDLAVLITMLLLFAWSRKSEDSEPTLPLHAARNLSFVPRCY